MVWFGLCLQKNCNTRVTQRSKRLMKKTITALRNRIISQLVEQADGLANEKPSQALGLLQVAESAAELKKARKALSLINRQNQKNAIARYNHETTHGRFGLEARLKAKPVEMLAEAESTVQGRRHLCEIWASLGEVLLEKNGLNDEEYQMACILLGAPDVKLRTSRARLDFDRALNQDKDRKFEVIDDRAQKYMEVYLNRMGDEMMRNFFESGDHEAAMFDTFLHRYKDWVLYLHHQLQEEEQFYYDWKNRPPTGRMYWSSTRQFIAGQIRKYRAMGQNDPEMRDNSNPPIVLTSQEIKNADAARRSVNHAMANYQKAVQTAKAMGLYLPEKTGKKTANT